MMHMQGSQYVRAHSTSGLTVRQGPQYVRAHSTSGLTVRQGSQYVRAPQRTTRSPPPCRLAAISLANYRHVQKSFGACKEIAHMYIYS